MIKNLLKSFIFVKIIGRLHPIHAKAMNGFYAPFYKIRTVPTIISFKEGKEYKRTIGNQPKNKILELLD
jgi:hypothetical protein